MMEQNAAGHHGGFVSSLLITRLLLSDCDTVNVSVQPSADVS